VNAFDFADHVHVRLNMEGHIRTHFMEVLKEFLQVKMPGLPSNRTLCVPVQGVWNIVGVYSFVDTVNEYPICLKFHHMQSDTFSHFITSALLLMCISRLECG
jgi:hypothetical protein